MEKDHLLMFRKVWKYFKYRYFHRIDLSKELGLSEEYQRDILSTCYLHLDNIKITYRKTVVFNIRELFYNDISLLIQTYYILKYNKRDLK